jgi:hypothetical protein
MKPNVRLTQPIGTPASTQPVHIDEWLDTARMPSDPANYAAFVLEFARMPAWKQFAYAPFMKQHKLFCTYRGERWRCNGASRMGDVWVTRNPHKEHGYDLRVAVNECSNWGPAL